MDTLLGLALATVVLIGGMAVIWLSLLLPILLIALLTGGIPAVVDLVRQWNPWTQEQKS